MADLLPRAPIICPSREPSRHPPPVTVIGSVAVHPSQIPPPPRHTPYLYISTYFGQHAIIKQRNQSDQVLTVDMITSSSFFTKLRCMVSPKCKKPPSQPDHIPGSSTTTGASDRRGLQLERVFRYFDKNGDGKISPVELRNCMKASGEELSQEQVEAVVRSTDSDGDGLLGIHDFLRLVGEAGEVGEEEGSRIDLLREAFGAYEMEGRGCITAESLKMAFRRLGESWSTGECREMIRRFDVDGDGVISFEEFRAMMV